MACPYSCKKLKELAGNPGEGVHKTRLVDAAMFDYIGTIFIAIIFSKLTKIPLVLSTIILFIIGELLHMMCGIKTSTVKYFSKLF